ncbi:MAG: Na/Pi cotransporter family protein, partial [Paludibacteraceae bacterium]|nr:Na/Pi cotransporter family protein [Paludibacteraceae bacterium]
QSSVAVMAITMILCSTGSLDIYSGIALVLGENIGTTITSNIAALTGNMQSRRAALFHFLFNTFGVIWVLFVFKPFVDLICNVVGFNPTNPDPIRITYVICAFHTSFNVCNVCILYGFIKYIEKLVCYILPSKEEEDEFRLKFISAGVMTTAELSIIEAYKETESYAERTERMFGLVKDLFNTTNEKDYNKLLSRIEKYEQICDNLEVEIGNYLNKISEGRLSASSKQKIFDIMCEVSEIESIGDSCYNLSKHINSIHKEKRFFTDKQKENIEMMFELVEGALKNMVSQVRDKSIDTDSNISFNIETEINNLRANLKSQNAVDINDKIYDYKLGVWYMDIINECEKLGDYVINVVEARKEIKFV